MLLAREESYSFLRSFLQKNILIVAIKKGHYALRPNGLREVWGAAALPQTKLLKNSHLFGQNWWTIRTLHKRKENFFIVLTYLF